MVFAVKRRFLSGWGKAQAVTGDREEEGKEVDERGDTLTYIIFEAC